MSAQAKLSVGSVASQTTYKFQRNVINSFLMHSFLVSPQIAFCCSMFVAYVDCQVLFVSE